MELKTEDSVISDFLQSMGPWREIIVIGGGYALIIYKLYLANQKLENPPVGTRDIDSLIPRKVPEISKKSISKHLKEAGFIQVFKDLDHPATESYVKEIHGQEIEIEFLTDSATRTDKNKNVLVAGVVAQPLSYLTMSLQTTREFTTSSEQSGWVVAPGAWIFHKGLTFTRRRGSSKAYKDLYGIWYAATQLEEFSEEALTELLYLGSQHVKWYKTLQNNLRNWITNASPLDWGKLEAQDPSGKLKRLNFVQIIQKIIKDI